MDKLSIIFNHIAKTFNSFSIIIKKFKSLVCKHNWFPFRLDSQLIFNGRGTLPFLRGGYEAS
jgi:hypothetical protein